jgi:hypothetical protein
MTSRLCLPSPQAIPQSRKRRLQKDGGRYKDAGGEHKEGADHVQEKKMGSDHVQENQYAGDEHKDTRGTAVKGKGGEMALTAVAKTAVAKTAVADETVAGITLTMAAVAGDIVGVQGKFAYLPAKAVTYTRRRHKSISVFKQACNDEQL